MRSFLGVKLHVYTASILEQLHAMCGALQARPDADHLSGAALSEIGLLV